MLIQGARCLVLQYYLITPMCCLCLCECVIMRIRCMCVDSVYNGQFECLYKLLKRQCSDDAAHVMVEFGHATNTRSMEYINCTLG